MTKEDLSFVADALLALTEEDKSAPYHTEAKLLAKIRTDDSRKAALFDYFARSSGSDQLVRSEYDEVFARAGLTANQEEVLCLRLQGHTFEDIGSFRGHSKQGSQRIFLQALKKLVQSHHVYPYTGLGEVYRSEVRRGPRNRFGTMQP
jgi:hypothetical protein